MPNKTIYVSADDEPIFRRAQELAGGNLSAAIAGALRRYVDLEDAREEGFDQVTVWVGADPRRKVRFIGLLLGEWVSTTPSREETYRVYRGRTGKFVVHVDRTAEHKVVDSRGRPGGWLANLGLDWNATTTMSPGMATLEIVDTLDQLRERIPPQIYEIVAVSAREPVVEELDV